MKNMPPKPLKIYLSPHWHVDHAWIKSHEQYMRELVVPNFRVLLKILKRYPSYKCSVEQATQWMSLKRLDPQIYSEIKPYVEKGNIDLVGGQLLSPDINIPNGESLIRNYFYGWRFLQEEFKKDTEIAWNIDLFGHIFQYPLILRHMDMNFYVFHRGVDDRKFRKNLMKGTPAHPPNVLFKWVDMNGKNPIIGYYQTNTYSSLSFSPVELLNTVYFLDVFFHKTTLQKAIMALVSLAMKGWRLGNRLPTRSMIKVGTAALSNFLNYKPFLKLPDPRMLFTTVGSDFTAPSAYLLHYWNYLQKMGKKQNTKFLLTTPHQFFNDALKISDSLGSVTTEFHEIGRIFSGVWSSRIRLKQNNRECERRLYDLESLASIQLLMQTMTRHSGQYPLEEIDRLWKICLINQFHDIACGCGIDLVYLQAMKDYEQFFTRADQLQGNLLQNIVGMITENQGNESGREDLGKSTSQLCMVINTLPWKRDVVFGDTMIQDIPGLGYKIIEIQDSASRKSPKQVADCPVVVDPTSELIIDGFKLRFENNRFMELIDSQMNKTILKSNGANYIGSIRMIQEKGDAYDTVPARILEIMEAKSVKKVVETRTQMVIEILGELDTGNAVIVETWTFNKISHEIAIHIDLTNDIDNIKLEFCIPHAPDLPNALASIQYGVKKNPKGIFPVQNWISFQNEDHGILFVNHGTPEHIYHAPNCYVTLIRGFDHIAHVSIKIPRKTPLGLEKGNYTFDFHIKPFNSHDLAKINLENMAMEVLHPIIEQILPDNNLHKPSIKELGLIEIPQKQVSISSIKASHPPIDTAQTPVQPSIAEVTKSIILRIYNPFENPQPGIVIKTLKKFKNMQEVNGNEVPIGSEPQTSNHGTFTICLDRFDLKTFKLH